MTGGSPQTERRTKLGASEREWAAALILYRYWEFIESYHITQVRSMLAAADAADEAAGIRRVTGAVEGFMFSADFDPENAEERCINGALATFDVPRGARWHSGRYVIAPVAADSPVGGVS